MKTLLIGRDAKNDIILSDEFVSRQHAQLIIHDNGQVMIKDLSSSNGTFVNGNKIKESQLNQGDVVKCASVFLDWPPYIKLANQNSFNSSAYQDPPRSNYSKVKPEHSENKLYINASIADDLPAMVKNELATLSAERQQEFLEEYKRKRKSIGLAYLFLIIILAMHYGYLRKWGLQIVFWLTGGGLFIWWFIDLFRTYGMVQDYNKDIAIDVIRNLKAISH